MGQIIDYRLDLYIETYIKNKKAKMSCERKKGKKVWIKNRSNLFHYLDLYINCNYVMERRPVVHFPNLE